MEKLMTLLLVQKKKRIQPVFNNLVEEYGVKIRQNKGDKSFLDKWYLQSVREEIDFVFQLIKEIKDLKTKKL